MAVELTTSLVEHVRQFLGADGMSFFAEVRAKYGKVNALWMENGIPHPVHFREGMQVRNCMRQHPDCRGWSAHDFDSMWVAVIEKCLGS